MWKVPPFQNRQNVFSDLPMATQPQPQFNPNELLRVPVPQSQNRQRTSMDNSMPVHQTGNKVVMPITKQSVGCGVDTCMNEGVCTVNGLGVAECKCPWGWTGARCEICLTECASNPCPSNKKCKAKYLGGYECVCPADKVGLDCEIQNDLCASEPCLNGGVCKPVEGGTFTCICDKPWSGENCERSN